MSTMADFESCTRVGMMGVEVFKELEELITEKANACLRGKISALEAENRYLDGELIHTSCNLKTYREYNLVAYFKETQSLKAELDKLSGVRKQLEDANTKVGEQSKQIPTLKADLQALRERLDPTGVEKKKHAEAIEQQTKDKAALNAKMVRVAVIGFECCLNMVMILEPSLNTDLLQAEYNAENGKIVHQG